MLLLYTIFIVHMTIKVLIPWAVDKGYTEGFGDGFIRGYMKGYYEKAPAPPQVPDVERIDSLKV